MLMGGFLDFEMVLALTHLLLLQNFDCSAHRIRLRRQTEDRRSGFDVRCPIVVLAGHRGAVPFTLALVSQGMRTRHTRFAAVRQPETVLITDVSTRISMARMLNQP